MENQEVMDIKVSVKDGKVCEKILKVEVAGDAIANEYEEYYRQVAPKAKIPGFRPGKAPRQVLELHYAAEADNSVLKHLIQESYRQAISENSLNPLGYPEVDEVKFDKTKLSYQAKVEIRPKIKLSKVAGLSAKKEKFAVKPEEIEEALKRVRESMAQFKAVEDRPSKMGDYVIADYVCLVDGKEIEKRSDDWFEIQEEEYLKGFSPQLVGLKAGDEKDIVITFPQEFGRKELAGKSAAFKVKIKEVKEKALPELNDELVQSLGGEVKTVAGLKEKIEKDILANKEHEAEVKYEDALLEELVKQNKIDLPEGLVSRRADRMAEDRLKREHQHVHGHDHDHDHDGHEHEHEDGQRKPSAEREKLRKELEPHARRQIHLAFLLDEIADQEKIQVNEEDIKARIEKVAGEVRQPLQVVEKYYQEHEEALQSLHDQIRNEKTIEHIKKNAKSE